MQTFDSSVRLPVVLDEMTVAAVAGSILPAAAVGQVQYPAALTPYLHPEQQRMVAVPPVLALPVHHHQRCCCHHHHHLSCCCHHRQESWGALSSAVGCADWLLQLLLLSLRR